MSDRLFFYHSVLSKLSSTRFYRKIFFGNRERGVLSKVYSKNLPKGSCFVNMSKSKEVRNDTYRCGGYPKIYYWHRTKETSRLLRDNCFTLRYYSPTDFSYLSTQNDRINIKMMKTQSHKDNSPVWR